MNKIYYHYTKEYLNENAYEKEMPDTAIVCSSNNKK